MESIIASENIRSFAYVNDRLCTGKIRGIVLSFMGLGCMEMFRDEEPPMEARYFGEKNILYVIPYSNPWSWMNRQTVDFTEEILQVLRHKYHLDPTLPLVSSGGSMGGHAAILYSLRGKHTPVACVANCPVCDLVGHFYERADLPRTIYSSLWNEPGSLRQALEAASPLHLTERLPRISYRIFHCECDQQVNLDLHSRKFTEKMTKLGHDIRLISVPERGHCDLPDDIREMYLRCCSDAIENA